MGKILTETERVKLRVQHRLERDRRVADRIKAVFCTTKVGHTPRSQKR